MSKAYSATLVAGGTPESGTPEVARLGDNADDHTDVDVTDAVLEYDDCSGSNFSDLASQDGTLTLIDTPSLQGLPGVTESVSVRGVAGYQSGCNFDTLAIAGES